MNIWCIISDLKIQYTTVKSSIILSVSDETSSKPYPFLERWQSLGCWRRLPAAVGSVPEPDLAISIGTWKWRLTGRPWDRRPGSGRGPRVLRVLIVGIEISASGADCPESNAGGLCRAQVTYSAGEGNRRCTHPTWPTITAHLRNG